MKYWICTKCFCVNAQNGDKCDGCCLPIDVVLFISNCWVEFYSIEELDKWIVLTKRAGSKIWRKKD